MRTRHKTPHRGIYYRLVDEAKPDGPRRYIVWYSDINSKGRTVTMPVGATLKESRLKQGELQARKASGETLIRTRKDVAGLLDEWVSTLPSSTAEGYEYGISVLKERVGQRRATDLSASDVARLISDLKREGKKTWTVKKVLTPLRSAYRLAVRDGLVPANPCDKLLPSEKPRGDQRQMRVLSKDHFGSLLTSCTSGRWKTLFATLGLCGLRVGEALALTWDDVLEDRIIVRKSKTEAGVREVMLIPAVRQLLVSHRLSQAPGAQFVFGTREDRPCGRREALRALRMAEERAGLADYTLHELRHTYASILIAQGELPTLVARQMGHADPGVTLKTYTHLWQEKESIETARERLQEAMGGLI
jgi:integrase